MSQPAAYIHSLPSLGGAIKRIYNQAVSFLYESIGTKVQIKYTQRLANGSTVKSLAKYSIMMNFSLSLINYYN